jgi:hypothetical protein
VGKRWFVDATVSVVMSDIERSWVVGIGVEHWRLQMRPTCVLPFTCASVFSHLRGIRATKTKCGHFLWLIFLNSLNNARNL